MKRFCWLALLGLGVFDVALGAEFSFGRPVRVMLERNTFVRVAIGDVNADGRDDIAATALIRDGSGTHRLSLFLQRTDGTIAAPVHLTLPYAGNHTYPVAVIDLDGDGAGEMVVGTGFNGLSVARLGGAGGLSAVDHPVANRGCAFLTSGDADADGHIDIVCHDWKESATIFYGDGSGGFRATLQVVTPAGTYNEDWKQLRLADVTGDGRVDLLVTASSVNSFFVHPNNGLGGFWPATVYTHPWSPSKVWSAALEVLDLDGDGVNEVVTASPDNRPDAAINVYRRGANGYLALSERIPIYDSPTALLAGDVDGDGDAELLAGHFSFNALTLLGANAAGLTSQARYDLPGFGTDVARRQGQSNGIAMGDLDHDGCNDLASATHSGLLVLYGCREFSSRVPVVDFDGDGVSDVLWRYEATGENYLWHFADLKAWHLCAPGCPQPLGRNWAPQAIGDFDGDGSSDVFWRDLSTGANQIWDRGLFPRAVTTVAIQDWQVVGAGDFDGDDRSDLLWRHGATGANGIWKSANSSTQQTTAGMVDHRWKVAAIGDFDGDRRSDILWRHSVTGSNAIWRAGRVETPQAVTPVPDLRWTVAGVGDFNGDGKDDLVWRHTSTGASGIWLAGNSATQLPVTTVANLAWTIAAVGDYNGDGRADLMWRNSSNGSNVIWRSADSRQTQGMADTRAPVRVVR